MMCSHVNIETADLTLLQVLPWIDGVRFIKRIALEANIEPALVRRCVEDLLRRDLVRLVDIFQFTNHYRVLSALAQNRIDQDAGLRQAWLRYACAARSASATEQEPVGAHANDTLLCAEKLTKHDGVSSKMDDKTQGFQAILSTFQAGRCIRDVWIDHAKTIDALGVRKPTLLLSEKTSHCES